MAIEPKAPALWKLSLLAFTLHSIAVAALIKIREIDLGSLAFWVARRILEIGDFWVYQWVLPLFNTRALGKPMYQLNVFLGLTTLQASSEFYEWLMLSVFGGVVYAGLAAGWAIWRKRKGAAHADQPAAA